MEYVIVTLRKISNIWLWLITGIGACFALGMFVAAGYNAITGNMEEAGIAILMFFGGSIFFALLGNLPRFAVNSIASGLEDAMGVREGKAAKQVSRHHHSHVHRHTSTIVHKMDDGSSLIEERR